jgi:hypothetical protein
MAENDCFWLVVVGDFERQFDYYMFVFSFEMYHHNGSILCERDFIIYSLNGI